MDNTICDSFILSQLEVAFFLVQVADKRQCDQAISIICDLNKLLLLWNVTHTHI